VGVTVTDFNAAAAQAVVLALLDAASSLDPVRREAAAWVEAAARFPGLLQKGGVHHGWGWLGVRKIRTVVPKARAAHCLPAFLVPCRVGGRAEWRTSYPSVVYRSTAEAVNALLDAYAAAHPAARKNVWGLFGLNYPGVGHG
jgi:hypothetical protein